MRVLIVGGSGLVGSHLLRHALASGHSAVGTYRERAEAGLEFFDASRLDDFHKLLAAHQPDVVVHAAGWTWVDGCESDPGRAMEENCHQSVRLAEICQRGGIRFAYFSTSYVFDGNAGPYDESASPNPINVYARSKREAEARLSEVTKGTVLLPRIICVFGRETRRKNFAYQILDAMKAGKVLTVPSDQLGNPTWAGDIARATVELITKQTTGPVHLGGAHPNRTRLEWAQELVAGFGVAGVVPAAGFELRNTTTQLLGQRALRPLHSGMISHRLAWSVFAPCDFAKICREIAVGK